MGYEAFHTTQGFRQGKAAQAGNKCTYRNFVTVQLTNQGRAKPEVRSLR